MAKVHPRRTPCKQGFRAAPFCLCLCELLFGPRVLCAPQGTPSGELLETQTSRCGSGKNTSMPHAGLLQSRGSRQRLGWLGSVRQWLRLGQLVENAEEILGLTHDTPGQCPVPGQCDLSGSSPPREPRADLPTQPQRLSSHEERLSALSKKRRSVRRARALDLPSFGLCEHVLTSWDEGRTPLRPSLAMQSLQSGSSGSSSRSRGFTWKGTSFRFFTPALWLPFPPFPTLAQVRMRRSLSESVRGER